MSAFVVIQVYIHIYIYIYILYAYTFTCMYISIDTSDSSASLKAPNSKLQLSARHPTDRVALKRFGVFRQVWSCCYDQIGVESLGKGSQANPRRPIRDYSGLLGLIRPYWEDLAPLVWALITCMTQGCHRSRIYSV